MEVLRTHDTGHADSEINWVICGGSGYGLRRQCREGPRLMETTGDGSEKHAASSGLYIGRDWPPADGRDAYSGLRVDIEAGRPLTIRPTPRCPAGLIEIERLTLRRSPFREHHNDGSKGNRRSMATPRLASAAPHLRIGANAATAQRHLASTPPQDGQGCRGSGHGGGLGVGCHHHKTVKFQLSGPSGYSGMQLDTAIPEFEHGSQHGKATAR